MKIYTTEDRALALHVKRLIRLHADCAALQWSPLSGKLSRDVAEAAETICAYVTDAIPSLCTVWDELIGEAEEQLIGQMKHKPALRAAFGSGVIEPEETKTALEALGDMTGLERLRAALTAGVYVMLF